jgi:hypothetical protein
VYFLQIFRLKFHIRGPFEKFVDSPYYAESELCWRSLFRSTSLGKRCTSYNTPPTSRERAADRWSLRNFLPRSFFLMVGKAQKSHGARSELNCVFGLERVDRRNPIRTSAIQFRSRPNRFLSFSIHEKGAPRQEISKWSTVCSTFSKSGWSVVRGASLVKGGTSKKRPSPHLHKVPNRSNKVSPRTFQTAVVHFQSVIQSFSNSKSGERVNSNGLLHYITRTVISVVKATGSPILQLLHWIQTFMLNL